MSLLLKSFIISNFIEKEFEDDTSLTIEYCNTEEILIDNQILTLNVFDKKKNNLIINLKNLNYFFLKKNNLNFVYKIKKNSAIENTVVLYLITISFFKKNTTIHVTDMKGLLKVFCSTISSLKLSNKRRKIQPKLIFDLLNYFLSEVLYFNDEKHRVPIALNLKNINKNYLGLIIKRLKFKFDIKIINYLNLNPHNGCRPRKIRRVKQRRKKK